ncbi:MAG: pyridoxal phosphate-dependent aminotransferase [Rhodospirillales bacterium]|nr:pyridoxal phosphate-dependent aminotransferase [Rhodospirillales bacterium]
MDQVADQGEGVRPGLAARVSRAQVSASVAMTMRARELRAAGVDVIALTIGEPGFASPPHAIEAAHRAALGGETKYPPQDGTKALKEAIQRKFRRDQGLDFGLDQIAVSNGGKQAIFNALAATVDPGSEVVIPVPSWNAYVLMTKLLDGTPVEVPCPQNNGFKPRAEEIAAAITPRTKWLVLNNPNNPTGAACSAEELAAIAAVLRAHPHVWILSDDMYEHLIFDGFAHATMAAVAPDLADRTLTVSGVSKTYAMTGWRIGFAAGPARLIKAMVNMQGQVSAGVSAPGQAAAAAALDGPQDAVAGQVAAYRRRRDLAVEMLNGAPGLICHKPEGAFYVFPNIAGCIGKTTPGGRRIATDADFTLALLEEAHVATVPGASYGMSPYFRVSTATDDAPLAEGLRRIVEFCRHLA